MLAPDVEDSSRFADFLKQNNTGLIKLVTDLGCDEHSVRKSDPQLCSQFSMPGSGSAYSFRQKDYQFWKLADLLYDGKSLLAFGQRSQGFLVNIGDISLTDVTRKAKGVDFVFSFAPAADVSDAAKQNTRFADGVRVGDFDYKKGLPVVQGNTYILRSVAYNGDVPRTERGSMFNELDFDKRKDVIVAFRVVKRDINGTLTVLWKILQLKQSPVLR